MRTFTLVLATVASLLGLASPALADAFDIPAGSSWTKVQDGEVVQWSVIPPHMERPTRLDLLSYEDNGVRTTYYFIRRECQPGSDAVEWQKIEPGHVLGIGLDCTGNILGTSVFRMILDQVDDLPEAAAALLP